VKRVRKIELLAPAKNLEYGIEAIIHGADAVYIGAPKFSARLAAGNSLKDIEQLVNFAHQYGARVYVALNTILKDDELTETETLIWKLYEAGIDALIIQDMGILMLNLPPIPLHASTQTDNRTIEKINFLEKAGFSRIILARELTINEIKNISSNSDISLEAFVHGALCVSFSGQCYLSQAITKRSANRGECAQLCRLPYTLVDAGGKEIVRNKHILSLKDLNLSGDIEEMLLAGIDSLKIEGRLKDLVYVKNVVAYYRQQLDKIINKYPEFIRSSSGKSYYTFKPDLNKSFNRGYSSYFFNGRISDICSPDSPKSLGEPIGRVKEIYDNFFVLSGTKKINNGDGLCFLDNQGELAGLRVNRVDGERVFPFENHFKIKKGTFLYRNYDHEFEKVLNKKSAERKIDIQISLTESDTGYAIKAEDEDGISIDFNIPEINKEIAFKDQTENIKKNLSKTGDTIFNVTKVDIFFSKTWFIPVSRISEWRRQLIRELLHCRISLHIIPREEHAKTDHSFPEKNITYLGNVMNKKSKLFYEQHQSTVLEPAFEIKARQAALMFTRHCIKYTMGLCPKETGEKHPYKEPFYLTHKGLKLRMEFDCAKCEMRLYQEP